MNAEKPSTEFNRDELRQKLNQETGQIEWLELQRHFARGVVIAVSAELDLVEVAIKFTQDDRDTIKDWLTTEKIKRADDDNARNWNQSDSVFWAIVVAPWILAQEMKNKSEFG